MKVHLNVRDYLDRALRVYPDRTAVIDEPDQPAAPLGGGSLTYREFGEHAAALAAGLDALGVGVGERVAVVSHNSARLLVAFFGVCGWGRVLVPINFRLHPEEVRYIVEQSGATVLLVDPELADAMADIECAHRFVIGDESDAVLFKFDTEPRAWEPDEDATATLNYTSGTTASPKGALISHRAQVGNSRSLGVRYEVTEGDKVEAQIRFGYAVNGHALGDLAATVEAVTPAQLDERLAEYEGAYRLAEAVRAGGAKRGHLADAARMLAAAERTTVGTVLLAAWHTLLHQQGWDHATTATIASPRIGRGHAHVVGPMFDILPLAVHGTATALPVHDWRFGRSRARVIAT